MTSMSGTCWEVQLPSNWHDQRAPEGYIVASDDAFGELQITDATKDEPVTNEDLRDFARHHLDAGAKTSDVVCGDYEGFTLHYGTEGEYLREWYLHRDNSMLFLTYCCLDEHRGNEDTDVRSILATLRYTPSAP